MVGARALGGLALMLGLLVACTSGPAGSSGQVGTSASPGLASPASTATRLPGGSPTPSADASGPPEATPTPPSALPLGLASTAFADSAAIPARYTCSGADGSPPLAWSHPPAGTVAYALVVVDTDASGFAHWVVADIPGDRTSIVAGERIGVAARNGFGGTGYGGPCPPVGSGVHHYLFTLYALSHRLGLGGVPTAAQVRAAAAKLTLATARLTGTYRR